MRASDGVEVVITATAAFWTSCRDIFSTTFVTFYAAESLKCQRLIAALVTKRRLTRGGVRARARAADRNNPPVGAQLLWQLQDSDATCGSRVLGACVGVGGESLCLRVVADVTAGGGGMVCSPTVGCHGEGRDCTAIHHRGKKTREISK